MSLYTRLVRPLLFRCDPEWAHHATVEACRWAARVPGVPAMARRCFEFRDPMLETTVAGLRFHNPMGLAAGWDKSGRALGMLGHLGFGFAEIGSISADPSPGNARPRLFRLPADRAIVVNYGLPNDGAATVARRLHVRQLSTDVPLGVNLVKTNRGPRDVDDTPESIIADYVTSARTMHAAADYLMLNLSCPNAAGGIDFFATPANIGRLLDALAPLGIRCPVWLKLAPSADEAFLDGALAAADPHRFITGFSFNLPPGKPAGLTLQTPRRVWADWPGAVAGRPVAETINRCVAALYRRMPRERYAIIAAGGVFTADDAYEKIRLGASLVQLYTALVHEGPSIVRRINQGLCQLAARDGFHKVSDAIGTAH
ncbi:MAG: quinone-dependent dihydroorotate dehydrogenase [Planctomycetes bacterium]|nr:quinone-dependent dihydroorotate dehydrogenase [Planctomycetota bacterium]